MTDTQKPQKSWLRRAFSAASDKVAGAGNTVVKETKEFGSEISEEVKELRNEGADFLGKHGKSRLKVGAATAFKVGILTAPIAKITVPVAFVVGALGGPYISRKLEGVLRARQANDDDAAPKPEAPEAPKEEVNGPPPSPPPAPK